MRVLLVKLSSLGDVVHNLPVATDLANAFPGIHIDWAVEAPYVDIVKLHPAINQVFPVSLRHLKKNWTSAVAWSNFLAERTALRQHSYDLIIDTQGLLKSAWVAHWASGPVAGYSRDAAREPASANFYQHKFDVSRNLHAVERNRLLAAQAARYVPRATLSYGIAAPTDALSWLPSDPYVVLLHATSRDDKMWPVESWVALGQKLAAQNIRVVIPAGSARERETSLAIAKEIPNAIVAPPISLREGAIMLSQAQATIGVDTGFAHLSVALGRPTVGLYISTMPSLTGLFGGASTANLGGGLPQNPAKIDVDVVLDSLWRLSRPG